MILRKEPHLIATFDKDFYGEELRVIVVGYIRDMNYKFANLEELIQRIKLDIQIGDRELQENDTLASYAKHEFFY